MAKSATQLRCREWRMRSSCSELAALRCYDVPNDRQVGQKAGVATAIQSLPRPCPERARKHLERAGIASRSFHVVTQELQNVNGHLIARLNLELPRAT